MKQTILCALGILLLLSGCKSMSADHTCASWNKNGTCQVWVKDK